MSSFLHMVKWFQVLLYNSHNLASVICLHTVCSIWPIDRTLSGPTTLGQSGPGNNGNEGVLHIPQIFKAGALPSNCLMSYLRYSLGRVTPLQRFIWCILQPNFKDKHASDIQWTTTLGHTCVGRPKLIYISSVRICQ